MTWEERRTKPPSSGRIRLFIDPDPDTNFSLKMLWARDYTLTDWHDKIAQCTNDVSDNPIRIALLPPKYKETLETIFFENQRKRWLARATIRTWTQRIWRKRTQCNIDMIDMQPVHDRDAIFMTDTKHHTIFRFHRYDIFTNLLTNICMSDEMLPSPRNPTNPWTNSVLTMPQTMSLCQQLVADYSRRGLCPPVLFAAFWAARFNLTRFLQENSAILAQHAVRAYFKDLHDENHQTVLDTITTLLTNAGLEYSFMAIRKWLRQTPQTPLHQEWLQMARDYTMYINLHVQIRPHWHSLIYIYHDVRRLYSRTILPNPASQRIRLLNGTAYDVNNIIPSPPELYGLLGLPMILQNAGYINDLSGSDLSNEIAIQLIQNALFPPQE